MAKPKIGDRLVYTGEYHPECKVRYPAGTVVAFRRNPYHGPAVTVRLDGEKELYADWPIKNTEPAPC